MTKNDVLSYLKEHYQEFHNQYKVEKIGLFGSYARDEATKDRMILPTLDDIKISLNLIIERCRNINSSDDFLENDGLLKLDTISMRLVAFIYDY